MNPSLNYKIVLIAKTVFNLLQIPWVSVEQLGIKEYLPAYLDPNLKSSDLVTGVCFASGASGYDPLTPKITVNANKIELHCQFLK